MLKIKTRQNEIIIAECFWKCIDFPECYRIITDKGIRDIKIVDLVSVDLKKYENKLSADNEQ